MEAAIAWIEGAEERRGELEDKIMEKEETVRKRGKKSRSVRGELGNSVTQSNRTIPV